MTTTLGDITDKLNSLMDDDTENFITNIERTHFINDAYFYLYTFAGTISQNQGPAVSVANLSIVADQATIALPADCLRVIQIYWKEDEDSSYLWLPILPSQQHNVRRQIARSDDIKRYYFRGPTTIVVVPTPSEANTTDLFVEYIPKPTAMSESTDEPTGIPIPHRELIAYRAFMSLKEKEGAEPIGASMEIYRNLMSSFENEMKNVGYQGSRKMSGMNMSGYYHGVMA